MAITVFERGQHPKDEPMKGTCPTCKSKIECLQSDAQNNEVTCPVCLAVVTMKAGRFPRPDYDTWGR